MLSESIIKLPPHASFGPEGIKNFLNVAVRTLKNTPFALILKTEKKQVYFGLRVDESAKVLIENQLYSTYPDIEFEPAKESLLPQAADNGALVRLRLKHGDFYPFISHEELEESFLTDIYNQLNRLATNDEFIIQVKLCPIDHNTTRFTMGRLISLEAKHLKDKVNIFESMSSKKGSSSNRQKAYSFAIKKNQQPLFRVQIDLILIGQSAIAAELGLTPITQAFSKLESDYNEFIMKDELLTKDKLSQLSKLSFDKSAYLFTSDEIATLFHFPPDTDKVPNLYKILSPKAEPPLGLPTPDSAEAGEINVFAQTNYRNISETFGIKSSDRARHMYIVGKSGSGKSKLQELLIKNDLEAGHGVCVIDPHGDLVENIIPFIPESRIKDTILFDPTDEQYPISFNPIERVEPMYRQQVSSNLIEVFKKVLGANWTPRLEHVMRMTLLALLDAPQTSIASILLLLTNRDYRQEIIKTIEDQVVKNFWTNEFAGWSEKFDSEAIMPILNKIGQFLSAKVIRNIVGQEDSKIVMSDIMNNRKILLVKLPKGILGDENTSLLGAMIITKIYQSALARANVSEAERVPFFMYVDEFQNFATDSFTNILSESRKYRLSLTVAHQYISQLPEQIKKTVFGNVGSIISFRVGPEDAALLEKEFEPRFKANDIINLAIQDIYLKMSIDGDVKEAFSARVLSVPQSEHSYKEQVVAYTRANYCKPREEAESEIEREKSQEMEVLEKLKSQDFSAPIL